MVLHHWWFGRSGYPSAIKTTFSWVLAGSIRAVGIQTQQQGNCYFAIASPDEFLKRFWEVEDYNLQQPLLSQEEQTVVTQFERKHRKDDTGRFIVRLPMTKTFKYGKKLIKNRLLFLNIVDPLQQIQAYDCRSAK